LTELKGSSLAEELFHLHKDAYKEYEFVQAEKYKTSVKIRVTHTKKWKTIFGRTHVVKNQTQLVDALLQFLAATVISFHFRFERFKDVVNVFFYKNKLTVIY
jgi:predicted neutral ceramidase superfamily lipid hydrolase